MCDLDEQILAAAGSAGALEGLARVIRLSLSRIADTTENPDAYALSRLAADLVRLSAEHKTELVGIVAQAQISMNETESEPDALLVH